MELNPQEVANMLVKDAMTAPAVTVHAHTSVKDALRLLDEHHITSLPVTDTQLQILGIVSEADLLRDAVRPDDRVHMVPRDDVRDRPARVEEVMSSMPMTVSSDSDLGDAVELMTATAAKSLPVVDAGRVVGMVSRSDIVHLLARSDENIRAEVDELLRTAGLECDVTVEEGVVLIDGPAEPAQRRAVEVIAGSVAGVVSVQVRG
jgi:CBS domain-containing protein